MKFWKLCVSRVAIVSNREILEHGKSKIILCWKVCLEVI